MKILKIVLALMVIYAGIVIAFESLIGYLQPRGDETLVITTLGPAGEARDRVLSRIVTDGQLYVAANHWPRAWYDRALANPDVRVTLDGSPAPYRAVPVTGAEHDRVAEARPLGFVIRFLTGFPPRYFLRLDPA